MKLVFLLEEPSSKYLLDELLPKILPEGMAFQRKYRVPDEIPTPKEELYRLIPEHHQIAGAKRVAPYMDLARNTSESFRQFVYGVRHFAEGSEKDG